ncbi:MAG: hypothetical protein AMXMBFR23_13750 [Chloroflexota bacterium]
MSFDDPNDVRFKPQDDCPLFSERLEAHLVAVYKGQAPNRGQFCGHCYTPVSRDTAVCSHCGVDARSGRKPVEAVPAPIAEALFRQRKIEARWVNGFAYLGLLIAMVGGIALVLAVPFFKDRLIYATIAYGLILLVGGRVLAGVLGGYYGDRIGFERARRQTVAAWERWLVERDAPAPKEGVA